MFGSRVLNNYPKPLSSISFTLTKKKKILGEGRNPNRRA